MPELFEYSDGQMVGLTMAGWLASYLLLATVTNSTLFFLADWSDGFSEVDAPTTFVIGMLLAAVVLGVMSAVMRYSAYVIPAAIIVAILVGLPYLAYRLGKRL